MAYPSKGRFNKFYSPFPHGVEGAGFPLAVILFSFPVIPLIVDSPELI